MVQLYATVLSLWLAAGHRLQTTQQEKGATAVEYVVLLGIGFAVATLIGTVIWAVANDRVAGIN